MARTLRRRSTESEKKLWALLRNHQLSNLKFKRQVPLLGYVVDFYCHNHQLIVELDGGQHADNPHDQKRDDELKKHGYKIIRIWNRELLENAEGCMIKILDTIEKTGTTSR